MSSRTIIAVAISLAVFLLHGCSYERRMAISTLKSVPSIKVVRYATPPLKKITIESLFAARVLGPGAAEQMAIAGGKEMLAKNSLPDFGKTMTDQFVQRVSSEVPGLPPLQVVEAPVGDDSTPEAEYLISLRVYNLQVDDFNGLFVWASAKMTEPNGSIPWIRDYVYKSRHLDRAHSLAKYDAGDGRLFAEEYYFALDKVVSELVRSLKGSKS